MPVHFNDKIVLIDLHETLSIQSEDGYTLFVMKSDERFIIFKLLSSFEFII